MINVTKKKKSMKQQNMMIYIISQYEKMYNVPPIGDSRLESYKENVGYCCAELHQINRAYPVVYVVILKI